MRLLRLAGSLVLCLGLGLGLVGCVSNATIVMEPADPPLHDESSISRAHDPERYSRIMIVPPTGTAGPVFEESLAAAERAFMRRGITVISTAITSRIILERDDRHQEESGLGLSELERALVLAKESNADGVLQIGTWRWRQASESERGGRYFVEHDDPRMVEVSRREYRAYLREEAPRAGFFRGRRYTSVGDQVLDFTGRLVDVESGEVMASFSMEVPKVRVAEPLRLELNRKNELVRASYNFRDSDYSSERERAAVVMLFDRMSALIAGIEQP